MTATTIPDVEPPPVEVHYDCPPDLAVGEFTVAEIVCGAVTGRIVRFTDYDDDRWQITHDARINGCDDVGAGIADMHTDNAASLAALAAVAAEASTILTRYTNGSER
jgi:hypothetical protein